MNLDHILKTLKDAGKIIGPGTLLGELLAGLRRVYTLEFPAPVADGKFYALDVRVKRTDATVRAPRAYGLRNNSQLPKKPTPKGTEAPSLSHSVSLGVGLLGVVLTYL